MQTEELGTTTGAKAEKLVVLLGGAAGLLNATQSGPRASRWVSSFRFHEYLVCC